MSSNGGPVGVEGSLVTVTSVTPRRLPGTFTEPLPRLVTWAPGAVAATCAETTRSDAGAPVLKAIAAAIAMHAAIPTHAVSISAGRAGQRRAGFGGASAWGPAARRSSAPERTVERTRSRSARGAATSGMVAGSASTTARVIPRSGNPRHRNISVIRKRLPPVYGETARPGDSPGGRYSGNPEKGHT